MQPDTTLPKTPRILKYTALMSVDENSDPVAEIIENTYNGPILWTKTGTGTYNGTHDQITEQYTTFEIANNWDAKTQYVIYYNDNSVIIEVYTMSVDAGVLTATLTDDKINLTPITITTKTT